MNKIAREYDFYTTVPLTKKKFQGLAEAAERCGAKSFPYDLPRNNVRFRIDKNLKMYQMKRYNNPGEKVLTFDEMKLSLELEATNTFIDNNLKEWCICFECGESVKARAVVPPGTPLFFRLPIISILIKKAAKRYYWRLHLKEKYCSNDYTIEIEEAKIEFYTSVLKRIKSLNKITFSLIMGPILVKIWKMYQKSMVGE